jgi:hypothetical protein
MALGLSVAPFAGCASALRFVPETQPAGTRLSADYDLVGGRLRVEIDSGGYRVEQAWIEHADGRTLAPELVEHPWSRGVSGVGVGFVLGGGRLSVGAGTSLGIDPTVSRPEANTYVLFPRVHAGPPPWRLHVKVIGIQPVTILLGP